MKIKFILFFHLGSKEHLNGYIIGIAASGVVHPLALALLFVTSPSPQHK